MYAVIASGGKQYRVTLGQVLTLEKLSAEEGQEVIFDEVLMLSDGDQIQIGQPLLEGIVVKGVVKQQTRAKKINIIKFRRRKHSMKRMGHRQDVTQVEIVQLGDQKQAASKPSTKPAPESDAKKVTAKDKAPVSKPSPKKVESEEKTKKVTSKASSKKTEDKPSVEKSAVKKADKEADAKKAAPKKPAKKTAAKSKVEKTDK